MKNGILVFVGLVCSGLSASAFDFDGGRLAPGAGLETRSFAAPATPRAILVGSSVADQPQILNMVARKATGEFKGVSAAGISLFGKKIELKIPGRKTVSLPIIRVLIDDSCGSTDYEIEGDQWVVDLTRHTNSQCSTREAGLLWTAKVTHLKSGNPAGSLELILRVQPL